MLHLDILRLIVVKQKLYYIDVNNYEQTNRFLTMDSSGAEKIKISVI